MRRRGAKSGRWQLEQRSPIVVAPQNEQAVVVPPPARMATPISTRLQMAFRNFSEVMQNTPSIDTNESQYIAPSLITGQNFRSIHTDYISVGDVPPRLRGATFGSAPAHLFQSEGRPSEPHPEHVFFPSEPHPEHWRGITSSQEPNELCSQGDCLPLSQIANMQGKSVYERSQRPPQSQNTPILDWDNIWESDDDSTAPSRQCNRDLGNDTPGTTSEDNNISDTNTMNNWRTLEALTSQLDHYWADETDSSRPASSAGHSQPVSIEGASQVFVSSASESMDINTLQPPSSWFDDAFERTPRSISPVPSSTSIPALEVQQMLKESRYFADQGMPATESRRPSDDHQSWHTVSPPGSSSDVELPFAGDLPFGGYVNADRMFRNSSRSEEAIDSTTLSFDNATPLDDLRIFERSSWERAGRPSFAQQECADIPFPEFGGARNNARSTNRRRRRQMAAQAQRDTMLITGESVANGWRRSSRQARGPELARRNPMRQRAQAWQEFENRLAYDVDNNQVVRPHPSANNARDEAEERNKQEHLLQRLIDCMPSEVLEKPPPGDGQCVICREPMCAGDQVRRLPCFHLFHSHCIDKWLEVKLVCPLDNLPVDAMIQATSCSCQQCLSLSCAAWNQDQ